MKQAGCVIYRDNNLYVYSEVNGMNANNDYNGIAEIRLKQTIFQQECFNPAQINLIIGRNGTGKSTFSELIHSIEPLSFQDERSAGEYHIIVFDHRYVLNNVMQYDSIPGIVTFSKQNTDIERQIAVRRTELRQCEAQLSYFQAESDRLADEKSKMNRTLAELFWSNTKDFRKQFENALSGKKTKQKLTEAILAAEAHYQDISTLSSVYDAAFGEAKPMQQLLNTIANINALDCLLQTELLTEPIISSSDSLFFRFIKSIHAVDWVQQGHQQFGDHTNGICPYCQQTLPADFEEQLASCVNAEYESELQQLQGLLETYRQTANQLFIPLQNNLKLLPAGTDYRVLLTLLKSLKDSIKSNLERIQAKIQSPSNPVSLELTKDLLFEIQTEITTINAAINESNRLIADRKSSQKLCADSVIAYLAHRFRQDIADYTLEKAQIEAARVSLMPQIEQLQDRVKVCSEQLKTLSRQIMDTETAVKGINQLLSEAGFRSFYLRKSLFSEHAYEVVRYDGNMAVNLSEGEQRFLAFLYFYFTVMKDTSFMKPIIAVLDDPFSGIDRESCEIILNLISDLMNHCGSTECFLRQLFVLTYHEDYFRNLTQNPVCCTDKALVCRFKKNENITQIEININR